MGCVEKHGLHLPLGTDCFEAEDTALEASKLETVCVFPTFVFGDYSLAAPITPEGITPPGTISLPVETEMLLLEQLCEQISRNGMKKIIIANAHGGNTPWLSTFLRKMYNKKHDFVVAVFGCQSSKSTKRLYDHLQEHGRGSLPYLTAEDEDFLLEFHATPKVTGHACVGESAVTMANHPETVHLDRLGIESGLSTHVADYLKDAGIQIADYGWLQNYPNNYSGHDPVGLTHNVAKAALWIQARRMAEAFRFMKEDEDLLKWHHEMQKGW
jgi:creatinine amidohydrolase